MKLNALDALAALLEKANGDPCGECGEPHASKPSDYALGEICICACCLLMFGAFLGTEYPDVVKSRNGVKVITEAMVDEICEQLETSLAERRPLDREASNGTVGAGQAVRVNGVSTDPSRERRSDHG